MNLRPIVSGLGQCFAGETIQVGGEVLDRYGRPTTPQPTIGVTVAVNQDDDATAVLAEVAATLQSLHGGTATGTQSSSTLQDTPKAWTVNEWAGKVVKILSGTGLGQERRIKSNTATTLTIDTMEVADGAATPQGPWSPSPSSDSVYRIHEAKYLYAWASPTNQAGEDVVLTVRCKDAAGTIAEKLTVHFEAKAV